MTTKFLSLASLAGVFFMNACSPGEEQTGTGYPQAFDVSNMDTSMAPCQDFDNFANGRSEEHTSELQSLMRISYAVFCLKKKNYNIYTIDTIQLIQYK